MHAILEGALCGLVLSFLLGPVFVGLVKTSLLEGFKQGVFFAMGVALSDIFYIIISYWGVVSLISNPSVEHVFYLLGGLFLFLFGLYYLFRKNNALTAQGLEEVTLVVAKKRTALVKGFLMNGINPSVLFFWMGIVGVVGATVEQTTWSVFSFFASSIMVVFSFDVLKAYLANKISAHIKDHWLWYLNKFLGLILCVIGSIFIWDTLNKMLVF